MTRASLYAAALAALAVGSSATAQSLANRVAAAPDGRVQFTYAAREGVCGNGRTFIQTGPNSFTGTFINTDAMRSETCVAGPVRVVLDRANRTIVGLQTFVGPVSEAPGATDLGQVRPQEAADFLLDLARRAEGRVGRDAIMPAMLAQGANTADALMAIAQNSALPRETRRSALSWMGRSTEGLASVPSSVTNALVRVARDEADNRSVRQQALSVLGRLPMGAGIPPLIELTRQTGSTWLAQEATTALSRSGDPRARQHLRAIVQRGDAPDAVMHVALRSLGREFATAQDAALLRQTYPRLTTQRTRDAVFSALVEMGGAENVKWLLDLARNENETLAARRRAAQSAHRAGAPIADLVRLYDTTTDPEMKGALITIYANSGDRAATDKLIAIARSESSATLRRRSINQLSRSDDPRVKQALLELVER